MDANAIKNKVLQEIKDLMDQKMVDGLKSKSPKFMKVETNDPEMAQDVVEGALETEDPSKEIASTSTLGDIKEDLNEGESDPDMEKLLELYKSLK